MSSACVFVAGLGLTAIVTTKVQLPLQMTGSTVCTGRSRFKRGVHRLGSTIRLESNHFARFVALEKVVQAVFASRTNLEALLRVRIARVHVALRFC